MGPILVVLALLFSLAATAVRADDDVAARLAAIRAELDPRAAAALERIPDLDRRLLAARAYLRAGAGLAARWSWTDAEIAAYAGSAEQARLDADLALVRREFERSNPGYTLYVNPDVRSLELQLERWNCNESVALAGAALHANVRTALAGSAFPRGDGPASSRALRSLLKDAVLEVPPNLAAPGLSLHGRMGAVDFQVQRGHEIVAGTESSEISATWEAQGWARRLEAAVHAATDRFKGPLRQPHEPWHYDYAP